MASSFPSFPSRLLSRPWWILLTLLVPACELEDLAGSRCNPDGTCGPGFFCRLDKCLPGDPPDIGLPFQIPNLDGGLPRDGGQVRPDASTGAPDAGPLPDASALDASTPADASASLDAAEPPDAAAPPDAGADAASPVDAAEPPDAAVPTDAAEPPDAGAGDAS